MTNTCVSTLGLHDNWVIMVQASACRFLVPITCLNQCCLAVNIYLRQCLRKLCIKIRRFPLREFLVPITCLKQYCLAVDRSLRKCLRKICIKKRGFPLQEFVFPIKPANWLPHCLRVNGLINLQNTGSCCHGNYPTWKLILPNWLFFTIQLAKLSRIERQIPWLLKRLLIKTDSPSHLV